MTQIQQATFMPFAVHLSHNFSLSIPPCPTSCLVKFSIPFPPGFSFTMREIFKCPPAASVWSVTGWVMMRGFSCRLSDGTCHLKRVFVLKRTGSCSKREGKTLVFWPCCFCLCNFLCNGLWKDLYRRFASLTDSWEFKDPWSTLIQLLPGFSIIILFPPFLLWFLVLEPFHTLPSRTAMSDMSYLSMSPTVLILRNVYLMFS